MKKGKKKHYVVSGVVTISVHTRVLASSQREAIVIAQERSLVSLCHQCANGDRNAEFCTSGELDGVVDNLNAEEERA